MSQLNFFEKLNLILWKNRQVLYYHWRHLLFCLFSSILFALLLVTLRISFPPEREAVLKFEPIDLGFEWRKLITLLENRSRKLQPLPFNCFVPRTAIAYAPNTSDYVNLIMEKAVADYLNDVNTVEFATTSELQVAMMNDHYLVGVKFETSDMEKNQPMLTFPSSLSFSLVFPSELRMWDSIEKVGASWHTYELFDSLSTRKRRNAQQPDGGFVGYVREGFASVQNAISMAYILLRIPNATLPDLTLNRFPYMAGSEDNLVEDEKNDVAFVLIMGFLYPVMFISLFLNREKETNIIVFFQIMGIKYGIQMIAWFIDAFLILFIIALIFIAALKIHWNDGFAILSNSSWIAVFFLFIAFNMASISFTFMIISFFDSSATAVLTLVVVWIFTLFPSALVYPFGTISTQLLACMLSNTCMLIAFEEVLKFESLGNGFHWSNFFDKRTIGTELSVGVLILILFALSVIYALVGLGIFYWRHYFIEIHKRVCLPIFRKFKPLKEASKRESVSHQRRLSAAFEVSSRFKRTWVEIKNLTKTYQERTVVSDFSLSLFQNEIMVLMGHNGCGKTVLLSMITGMIKPTSGTVNIDGFNISIEPDRAFEDLGLCLQDDLLIPELNVFNQLLFHCRMKGLSYDFLENDIEKYLVAMNVYDSRDQITGELSMGLKRFLSVCCALCGGSKFVVLDEPDTGMDLVVRKKFRDILMHERYGRTILMTTHSTTEADCIADRISIMSGGVLKCYGTSNFLRNMYCNGFNLVCKKDEQCDSKAVTDALQQFLPARLVPESDIGSELSYRLDQKYSRSFSAILDYMEQNHAKLNIVSVAIGQASIEDVFLSMGIENPNEGTRERLSASLNGIESDFDEEKNMRFLNKTKNYKGFQLFINQWKALIMKRFLFDIRVRPVVVLKILTPLVFMVLSFPLETKVIQRHTLPVMTYRLSQYEESVTLLDMREDVSHQLIPRIMNSYQEIIMSMGLAHKYFEVDEFIFGEYILDFQPNNQNDVNLKYLIAASFKQAELKAWFNNYPLHTVPLTLNMMHNAILRALTNDDKAIITVSHEPLPYASRNYTQWYFDGSILAIDLAFSLSIVWSTSILNLVRERKNKYKMLMYTRGARPLYFWQAIFFYDFMWNIITSTAIALLVLACGHHAVMQLDIIVAYFITLVVLGSLILPFNYAVTYVFNDALTAFCIMIFISLYGCISFFTTVTEMDNPTPWLFRIIPYYSLASTLFKIFHYARMEFFCKDDIYRKISVVLEGCEREPNCCSQNTIWNWSKYAVLPEVLSILLISVCSLAIIIIVELRGVNKAGIFNPTIPEDNKKAAEEDYKAWHDTSNKAEIDSMQQEQFRILKLKPREYFEKPLILKAVGNIRKNSIKLRRIFLVVNRSECLGVFGTCVSGKTAFMNMLVDNSASSYGQIYVNGQSLRTHLYEVYRQIGYCPQITDNLGDFYAYEVLKIICMVHGIPRNEIKPISEGLAKVFGYWSHYEQQLKNYSPGLRRRFRCSVVLIGNPSIVYLDEPMIYLDLGAIRKLCFVICRLRNIGTSVLFASLRFWISEIFCSRMSFISDGRLSNIGTPKELDNKFFKGYLLKLKIKTANSEITALQLGSTDALFLPNPFLKVQTFIETSFPNAILKDQRGRLMYFLIPKQNMKISFIFEELIRNEFILNIETFNVSSNTLPMFYYETLERHDHKSRN